MCEEQDRRRGWRVRVWFEVWYANQRQEDEGILADISYSGARVESTTFQPKVGAHVRLRVTLPGDAGFFEPVGHVVRHTASGFAIEFENRFDPRLLTKDPTEIIDAFKDR
jgi:hypothetical protein